MSAGPIRPVRWLDAAYVDLAAISDFIARYSILAAIQVSDGIQDKADLLGRHPFLGEEVP